jgi:hypothetical protein
VAAGPTDTVADVKAKVEAQTGVPAANQTLAYAPVPATHITVGLPASMHATHGPTITLAVDPATETVADVKQRVEAQTGVPPADQTLSFGGAPLSSDGATLGSYGVPSGGEVDLAIPAAPPAMPFAVKVEMPPSLVALYGSSITIPTSTSETVADVKAKVESITGMSAAEQALMFDGSLLLRDERRLRQCGIRNGDVLKLSRPLTDDGATLGSEGVPNKGVMDMTLPPAVPAAPAPFVVKVALPPSLQPTYGTTLTIPTSASASVRDLKSRIASITGMSEAEQQLAFGSLPLTSDAQTLGGSGIASGDTVTLSEKAPSVAVALPPEVC